MAQSIESLYEKLSVMEEQTDGTERLLDLHVVNAADEGKNNARNQIN